MNKEFTKSDLKVGMVVETREYGLYIFIDDNLIVSEDVGNDFNEWNENLKYKSNIDYEWDIIRVYKPNIDKIYSLQDILNKECLELIWEGNEVIEPVEKANKFKNITNDELLEEVKRRFK